MISYSRHDVAEVDTVLSELSRYGLHVWKDTSNMQPGEDWRATLLKMPRSVDGFIPFLSKHYVDSSMCRMELFLARATERNIFPIMLTECWRWLDTKEETKYISALFAARMEALRIVSLPVSRDQMLERFASDVKRKISNSGRPDTNVYVSYPGQAGPFATRIRNQISDLQIKPWIATLDCEFGSDWRKSQVVAMKRARVHIVIISKDFLEGDVDVLRTEVLMSESLGIEILGVEAPELEDADLHAQMYDQLKHDEIFQRITKLQWYKEGQLGLLKERISSRLAKRRSV
jgi:hypothetical protein